MELEPIHSRDLYAKVWIAKTRGYFKNTSGPFINNRIAIINHDPYKKVLYKYLDRGHFVKLRGVLGQTRRGRAGGLLPRHWASHASLRPLTVPRGVGPRALQVTAPASLGNDEATRR